MNNKLINKLTKAYLEPLDVFIQKKVFYKNKKIELFDEYQIKWFNQQSPDDLIEYFKQVIDHYELEKGFLLSSSNLIRKESELTVDGNYAIYKNSKSGELGSETGDEINQWLAQDYKKDNYSDAIFLELGRVLSEFYEKNRNEWKSKIVTQKKTNLQ
jgi:hypothetical protein